MKTALTTGIVTALSVRDAGRGLVVLRLRREDDPKDPGKGHVCTGSYACDGDAVDAPALEAWYKTAGVPVRAALTPDPHKFGVYAHAELTLTRPATVAQGGT